jgi:hypothetical protein
MIGVVCDDDHINAPEKDNVKEFRNLLKNSSRFQSPRVAAGSQGFSRKVQLNPPRLSYPGRRAKIAAKSWKNFTGHPSLEPINIICRSFNAFSTYLYRKGRFGLQSRQTALQALSIVPGFPGFGRFNRL